MSSYKAPRCRHIKVNGTQCGSPALRNKNFCFYHEQDRPAPVACLFDPFQTQMKITVPFFEDAHSVQTVVRQVVLLILRDRIEMKTASTLLYALQIASANLKRMELEKPQPEQVVTNLATDSETPMAVQEEALQEEVVQQQTAQEEAALEEVTLKGVVEEPTCENSTNAQLDESTKPIDTSAQTDEDLPLGSIQACSSESDWAAHAKNSDEEFNNNDEEFLGNPSRLARRTNRFKPAADIHLRVPFAAEMPCRRSISGR